MATRKTSSKNSALTSTPKTKNVIFEFNPPEAEMVIDALMKIEFAGPPGSKERARQIPILLDVYVKVGLLTNSASVVADDGRILLPEREYTSVAGKIASPTHKEERPRFVSAFIFLVQSRRVFHRSRGPIFDRKRPTLVASVI